MNELVKLQTTASPTVLRKFERLQAAADASLHNSPAQRDRGQFLRDFADNPARVEAEAEIEETQSQLAEEQRRLEAIGDTGNVRH